MSNNKCPKCGEKLSFFYLKQNCPKCGANLLYYDFENRLEEDHINAMKEEKAVKDFLYRIKLSSVGGAFQIIRLISFFIPIGLLFTTLFKLENTGISAITYLDFKNIDLSNILYLLPLITIAFVVIYSLVAIIFSLFSAGKNSFVRNIIVESFQIIVFVALIIFANSKGLKIGYGSILIILFYIIQNILTYFANNNIKKQLEK